MTGRISPFVDTCLFCLYFLEATFYLSINHVSLLIFLRNYHYIYLHTPLVIYPPLNVGYTQIFNTEQVLSRYLNNLD